jgi:hypothetical protein
VSTRAHLMLALLVACSLVLIVRLVRHRQLKAKYSLLWLSLGGLMVVFAAVPGLLDWTADRLGIYYEPTLLLMLGIALLLLIVMHFSYELTRMENRVRSLAEEAALVRRRLSELESRLGLGPEREAPPESDTRSGDPHAD